MEQQQFKTLEIVHGNRSSRVSYLYLNRPSSRNAFSLDFFDEFPRALSALDRDPAVHAVVLAGRGDHFCSGIDVSAFATISADRGTVRMGIRAMQDAISALERCRKPVVAAIHGACIGGGVDLVTACDIRYCTDDAFFSVKEVDLGITADLGTLQRLPGIVGYGNALELALTARRITGSEARELGLVSRVFGSKREMDEGVRVIAEGIASKPPHAVIGTKAVLLRSKDLTLDQGLDYVATWNSAMLVPQDIAKAISERTKKSKRVNARL